MDYKSNLKNFLMKGKMFRVKGQGIAGTGSLPQMQLSPAFREGGTISHRALVGSIIPEPSGQGIQQVSTKKKKNTDFKPLKFNL
jgi:hypothetical protein